MPYIPNFLAFREVPAYQAAVREFESHQPPNLLPDVYMLDSNGTLHARRFGAACHLGVLLNRPCFGVAKNLALLEPEANGLPLECDGVKQREVIREVSQF